LAEGLCDQRASKIVDICIKLGKTDKSKEETATAKVHVHQQLACLKFHASKRQVSYFRLAKPGLASRERLI